MYWWTAYSRHNGYGIEVLLNRHEVYERAKGRKSKSLVTRNWTKIDEVELNPRNIMKISASTTSNSLILGIIYAAFYFSCLK